MIIWRSMPFKLHRNTCNLYKYTIQQNQVNHILLIIFISIPDSSVGKESACNAGDPGSILGSGRLPGEGIGYPLQFSWASLVAQLVKNLPQPGRPGSDPLVVKIPWRKERLPTPVFWPRELHGQHSTWGRKELDMTEQHIYIYIYVHTHTYIYTHTYIILHNT